MMTAARLRLVPGTAPAASAPPKVMISSVGTGMPADSATMSKNTAEGRPAATSAVSGSSASAASAASDARVLKRSPAMGMTG